MALRHCMIGIQGRVQRAVCTDCGRMCPVGGECVCGCGGVVILVEDENTTAGIHSVENEIHRMQTDEAHRRVVAERFAYVKTAMKLRQAGEEADGRTT